MEPARTRHKLLTPPPQRGFTLVEMLVVLAIIVIITGIALVGQSTFNRSLILTDTAYTVALSIRESQSLGLSSRKVVDTLIQNAGYGVYFTPGTSYVQYADIYPTKPGDDLNDKCAGHEADTGPESRPGNCKYDSGQDTIIKTYRFDRGFTVSRFCGESEGGIDYCSSGGEGTISGLSIVFLRPNTESSIIGIRSGGEVELVDAEIFIQSADGQALRAVCVSKVGQVAVATSTCP
ncbi:MAG: type II secretion system protein [Candidatus Pacebacteria bacterium]|nr:type II secretion system protein [Candidatus Paceibacterota bacterium]